MNQHDLLTQLDDWANGGGPICNEGAEIAELMRLAAAEIRRLSPQIEPLTDEESKAVSELFEQQGNQETSQ
jgi:hypothetical protein